jgi:tetratricopeptide (TPR) repeat protein
VGNPAHLVKGSTRSEGGVVVHTRESVRVAPPRGPFAQPLALARRAAGADPSSYPSARALGAALYRAGKHDEAVKVLTRAAGLRKGPSPSVWLLLALAQKARGQAEEAQTWRKKAVDWIGASRREKGGVLPWGRIPWPERVALEALAGEVEKVVGE